MFEVFMVLLICIAVCLCLTLPLALSEIIPEHKQANAKDCDLIMRFWQAEDLKQRRHACLEIRRALLVRRRMRPRNIRDEMETCVLKCELEAEFL